jgi:hypothetical protein
MVVKTKKNKKKDLPKADDTIMDTTQADVTQEVIDAKEEHKEAPSKVIQAVATAPVEEVDIVDDWENADIDDLASKIVTKEVMPSTATGKAIRQDEEDKDEVEVTHKVGKDQMKIKASIKQAKEE